MSTVEDVLACQCKLGEGPVWSAAEQALYWVDIENHRFSRLYPASGKYEVFDVGLPVAVLALRASGGLVMATKEGFAFWHWQPPQGLQQGLQFIANANPEAHKPHNRFNDGEIDCRGRFWAGTMCEGYADCAGSASLYRLDPDYSVSVMETGLTISNGIGWSPDNTLMYLTDSPDKVIYVYDFDADSGTIANRRPFVSTPDEAGVPDGLAVDSEGYVWTARWGGWKITRYDPDGKVERVIDMPVECPTSCAFGGPNLDELYVTSAWTALSEQKRAQQPQAGDLFRVQVGIKGLEQYMFAG
jgi:sugar lactone lactonase YvrE